MTIKATWCNSVDEDKLNDWADLMGIPHRLQDESDDEFR